MEPKSLVTRFLDSWPRAAGDELAGFFTNSAHYQYLPGKTFEGLEQIRAGFENLFEAAAHYRFEVRAMIAEADVLAAEYAWLVTAKEGGQIVLPAAGIFEIADGKIAAWRDYYDSSMAAPKEGAVAEVTKVAIDVAADREASSAIVTLFCDAWSRLDPDELAGYFADDGVFHDIPRAPVLGRDAIHAAMTRICGALEGIEFETLHQVANGNVVINERVDHMESKRKLSERPAVGIFEIADGKIAAWRDYCDPAAATG